MSKPKVLIPVFPGTNCEYDSLRYVKRSGLDGELLVLKNITPQGLEDSMRALEEKIRESKILFLPGGFSAADEPEGSGKFITSFLSSPRISDAIMDLVTNRDGLILGICNGFQALIKLGLLPYGKIGSQGDATLSYNTIGRHQSKIVNTKVTSNVSPWLCETEVGEIYQVPVSHGEGRFIADENLLKELDKNGQIATRYVDRDGNFSASTDYNPNGSDLNIEGIISPDGRIYGKMGHVERYVPGLYQNVPGNYDMPLFKGAARYYA